jgi:hypothetical protein
MINHKNNTDDFLKDFIQKAENESPSANFTKNVMHKISEAGTEPSFISQILPKIKGWYFLILAGSAVTIYTLYYFLRIDAKFFLKDFDPIVYPVFKKVLQSFAGLFNSMQISSFTIVIILAIIGLFLVDRIINKIKTGKQIYFIIY